MQLPLNSHPPTMSVPALYNNYFATTPQSRPIRINAPSTHFSDAAYNIPERVMGLDFDDRFSAASSEYDIDFMDYDDLENDQPHASSSHSVYSPVANSIEEVLRRTILSDDNKENSAAHSSTPKSLAPMTIVESSQMLPISGKSQMQSQKLQTYLHHDSLINEETESEAGFSGDDDECMSNCGCVHSDSGTPADVSENAAAPFNRLGFRSVGDIIGYAQVVRSERLEALAELRSAVEKFNDMRQRNQNLRSKLTN